MIKESLDKKNNSATLNKGRRFNSFFFLLVIQSSFLFSLSSCMFDPFGTIAASYAAQAKEVTKQKFEKKDKERKKFQDIANLGLSVVEKSRDPLVKHLGILVEIASGKKGHLVYGKEDLVLLQKELIENNMKIDKLDTFIELNDKYTGEGWSFWQWAFLWAVLACVLVSLFPSLIPTVKNFFNKKK